MPLKSNFINILKDQNININYNDCIEIRDKNLIQSIFINFDINNVHIGGNELNMTNSGIIKFYISNSYLHIYQMDIRSICRFHVDYIKIYINGNNDNCDPEIFVYGYKDKGIDKPIYRHGLRFVDETETFDKDKIDEYYNDWEEYNNYITDERPEKIWHISEYQLDGLVYYMNIQLTDVVPPTDRQISLNKDMFWSESKKFKAKIND